jgi:4-amino-4-deoxy-L-arabinose transferase-like glycosyltransferase
MPIKRLLRAEVIFIFLILLIGSFLRLYRFGDTFMFQGDQGRDAMVAKAILKDGDLALIGPVTSVGNMYLGPLYYYLMVPALAVTYPDPSGPAYLVAILGIITIWLVYKVTREVFGLIPAVISAAIYSVLNLAVVHSRFSWNPNPAQLVGLFVYYSTYKAVISKKYKWFVGAFLGLAILTQLHYIALLMAGVVGVGLLLALMETDNKANLFKIIGIGLLIILASFLPLIAFDYRHDFVNWKALVEFLTGSEEHILGTSRVSKIVGEIEGRTFRILAQVLGTNEGLPDRVVAYGSLVGLVIGTYKKKLVKSEKVGLILLLAWLVFAILGTSVYSSSIFDHYLSYLYAAPVLLVGVVVGWLVVKNKLWYGPVSLLILFIMYLNLQMPAAFLRVTPKLSDIKSVSDSILERVVDGEKYNLVSLAEGGDIDAQNYRYFLVTSDKKPVETEKRGEVETLFIIREVPNVTRVVDSPVYEIVVFPNKNPVEVYTVGTTEVTVLKKS